MTKCWHEEAKCRPSFAQLVEDLDEMLQETARCTKVNYHLLHCFSPAVCWLCSLLYRNADVYVCRSTIMMVVLKMMCSVFGGNA